MRNAKTGDGAEERGRSIRADLMHLHPESVKRLARTGTIIAAKVGGVWRFRVSALEAYIQKLTENTQTRIAQNMAPSESAVGVVRNWRK
jgi:hypothetical protein